MRRTARPVARKSIAERKAQARKDREAERVEFVRKLLEQRAAMERMSLSELEWVLFKLGCSSAEGERLIALAKEAGSV